MRASQPKTFLRCLVVSGVWHPHWKSKCYLSQLRSRSREGGEGGRDKPYCISRIMLLFRSSWLQTCVLHSISFLSPFVQASLHGDVSEDWSLFTSSPLAEDYGLDGMAVEESNALPFQSTGDVYIDFSGNELFPPSGECACLQLLTISILVIDSSLRISIAFHKVQPWLMNSPNRETWLQYSQQWRLYRLRRISTSINKV